MIKFVRLITFVKSRLWTTASDRWKDTTDPGMRATTTK